MAIEQRAAGTRFADRPQGPSRHAPLWRLFGWGSAARVALAAVALTSQTEAGSERLQLALRLCQRARARALRRMSATRGRNRRPRPSASQPRCAMLAADRDRLTARIAMLERNLEDMTGSIKRQAEHWPPPRRGRQSAATAERAGHYAGVAAARRRSPPVIAAGDAAAPCRRSHRWRCRRPARPPRPGPRQPDADKPRCTRQPPIPTSPLPPVRVAAAPASEPAAEPPPPRPNSASISAAPPTSKSLRMPLGGGEGQLRAAAGRAAPGRCAALAAPGAASTYRLVVGPLPNAAAAARLCARFAGRPHRLPAGQVRRPAAGRSIDCRRAGVPA